MGADIPGTPIARADGSKTRGNGKNRHLGTETGRWQHGERMTPREQTREEHMVGLTIHAEIILTNIHATCKKQVIGTLFVDMG